MLQKEIPVPFGTPVIVVDPLKDFACGVFVECYGMEDTEPIRELIARLQQMVEAWQGKARLVLCKSLYDHNQFAVPKLETLCTTDDGRESVISRNLFQQDIIKRQNSFAPNDVPLEPIVGDARYLIMTGLTTTHCVIQSIVDCRRRLGRVQLIVPANAVGTRKMRESDGQRILGDLSHPHDQHVVVPRWEDIRFTEEKPLIFD